MPRFKAIAIFLALLCIATILAGAQNPKRNDWQARLQQELPLMGHRNWIAIVDSAYPLQISPGVETIETNADHLEVVRVVLDELAQAKHVRPVIFTDAELQLVPESDAKGVTAYRESLRSVLAGKQAQSLPHEQIISRLDEAGKTFHVLVLKTTMTIPYTSVFMRLDCGYWTDEQEKRLRERIR